MEKISLNGFYTRELLKKLSEISENLRYQHYTVLLAATIRKLQRLIEQVLKTSEEWELTNWLQ